MQRLKSIDSEIQITLQIVASRTEMACALRWNTPRSSASNASTNRLKPTHSQIDPIGLYLSYRPWGTKKASNPHGNKCRGGLANRACTLQSAERCAAFLRLLHCIDD